MRGFDVRGRSTAALLGALVLGGCYTYQPTTLAQIEPESRVRVTVSSKRAAELEPALRGIRPQFVAEYVGQRDASLLLSVPLLGGQAGTSTRAVYNRVDVPTTDIVALEARRFSRWRTGAVAAILVAAVGYGGYEVFNTGDDEEGKQKPPEIEAVRIPLFSIPFGR